MKTNQIKMIFLTLMVWGVIQNANAQFWANKTLSNLSYPTAINQSLLPGTDNTYNFGNGDKSWHNGYFDGFIYIDGKKFISNPNPSSTFIGNTGNNSSIGKNNTVLGYKAFENDISGFNNVAIGARALNKNSHGAQNVAIGTSAFENSFGSDNVAIGERALYGISTSTHTRSYNIAIGLNALSNLNSGNYNIAIGPVALISNTNEFQNTGIGPYALVSTVGGANTAVGYQAGTSNVDGYRNTYIGWAANSYDNSPTNYSSTAIGDFSGTSASYQVRLGNDNITTIGGFVDYTTLPCDKRFKKNIQENVTGLEFINKLRPVTYNVNMEELEKTLYPPRAPVKDKDGNSIDIPQLKHEINTEKEKIQYSGFIAQEVEQAAKDANYDFSGVDKPQNDHDLYGLRYGTFVVPLVKSVQELSKENDELKDQNAKLQKQLEDVAHRMDQFEKTLSQCFTENVSASGSAQLKEKTAINNPQSAILEQNAPNPFSSNTTVRFFIPSTAQSAFIKITDAKENELKSFSISERGASQISISANSFAAGIYTYQLIVDGKIIDAKRMTLTK